MSKKSDLKREFEFKIEASKMPPGKQKLLVPIIYSYHTIVKRINSLGKNFQILSHELNEYYKTLIQKNKFAVSNLVSHFEENIVSVVRPLIEQISRNDNEIEQAMVVINITHYDLNKYYPLDRFNIFTSKSKTIITILKKISKKEKEADPNRLEKCIVLFENMHDELDEVNQIIKSQQKLIKKYYKKEFKTSPYY